MIIFNPPKLDHISLTQDIEAAFIEADISKAPHKLVPIISLTY